MESSWLRQTFREMNLEDGLKERTLRGRAQRLGLWPVHSVTERTLCPEVESRGSGVRLPGSHPGSQL